MLCLQFKFSKMNRAVLNVSCTLIFHSIPFQGHSAIEGQVMSEVQEVRDDLCDNLPTTEPLTAPTGNLNTTSALSHNLSLLRKGDSGEQGLFHNAPLTNRGSSRDRENKKEGNGEGNRDDAEEDLDELMREEDEEKEDLSEGSNSIICCQSLDTSMTDSSYSETGQQHTHTVIHCCSCVCE